MKLMVQVRENVQVRVEVSVEIGGGVDGISGVLLGWRRGCGLKLDVMRLGWWKR